MLNHSSVDTVLQAIAEPTRRRMVEELSRGPLSVSQLARPFHMTLSAIVQHLAILETAGVVRTEKVGRVRTCRLDPDALGTAERWVQQRRREWERRFDRLDAYLAPAAPDARDDQTENENEKEPSP